MICNKCKINKTLYDFYQGMKVCKACYIKRINENKKKRDEKKKIDILLDSTILKYSNIKDGDLWKKK